jgi:hypothetical protein
MDITSWNGLNDYEIKQQTELYGINHRHLGFGAQNAFKIQIKCIFVNPSTCTEHIYKKILIYAVLKKNHISTTIMYYYRC